MRLIITLEIPLKQTVTDFSSLAQKTQTHIPTRASWRLYKEGKQVKYKWWTRVAQRAHPCGVATI